ncbi:syntaxin-binding protein 1 [Nematocida displodere]|uniref:Syntaxin-binding protein 1 n=1 Tax=Nematocida displodere TaxID=1805483 RepID=A0A177EFH2_9MICR|nr:syntaxin-binding protein 1 [Nematocida displodere]
MNLVRAVGERIKRSVLGTGSSEKEWRILIISQETAKLLHHALPMSEVLSCNIAAIERIEEERASTLEFGAIYFVHIDAAVLKRLQKDASKETYQKMYVVIMNEPTDKQTAALEDLAAKAEKKRKKGKEVDFVFKTVIFDFLPVCIDVFQINTSFSFYSQKEEYVLDVSEKLEGLASCLQLSATPIPVGRQAKVLTEKLGREGPSKLVVIERGSDISTPLLHFFTFESLLWDIGLGGPGYVIEEERAMQKTRKIHKHPKSTSKHSKSSKHLKSSKNSKSSKNLNNLKNAAKGAGESIGKSIDETVDKTLGTNPDKDSSESEDEGTGTETESSGDESSSGSDAQDKRIDMNEDSKVWESIRNTQLIETHRRLSSMIQEATKSSEKDEKGNIKRLAKAVQDLPSQTRALKEIKILMGLLEQCIGYFNNNNLKSVAMLEQGLATGKTAEGRSFKHGALKELSQVLEAAKLTREEKYRLYLLFIANIGSLPKEEICTLIEDGHVSKALIEQAETVKKLLFGREIKPHTKGKIPIARYVPLVHDILHAIISKNAELCSSLKIILPSERKGLSGTSLRKREFVFKAPVNENTPEKNVLILFFIGGVTIAEITEVREAAKNAGIAIIVGSTHICSPNDFLGMLKDL